MITPHRVGALLIVPLIALAVFGCSTTSSDPTTRERTTGVSNELRHDPETLQKYFPLIGTPVAVSWVGRNNSGGAPGPTTYWIDAVVELDPATATALRTRYASSESAEPPALPPALQVPAGKYSTNPDFDTALGSGAEWGGTATGYLHTQSPILVFTAIAGG
ncbi:hypothetical protein GFY24_18910 [Nocardia sp. SYP-A9097]|uniref:hypothetical protein n=1 Tax=Nocardia sp. SYP-A9097 TaxID=2663237 RepID=UPI00129B63DB|nr:hypothetical protein [Nocardia sp. SYP-A9097]MRH89491.1 hypothetical protein [Nocardia sp. SYP-A9097]